MKSILNKVLLKLKTILILGNVSLYVMLLRTEVRKNFHNLLMLLNTFEIVSKKKVHNCDVSLFKILIELPTGIHCQNSLEIHLS